MKLSNGKTGIKIILRAFFCILCTKGQSRDWRPCDAADLPEWILHPSFAALHILSVPCADLRKTAGLTQAEG